MVPDHRHVPQKLFATGLFNLKTEEGHGAFTDATIAVLHAIDKRWGHLRKNRGQSHIHHHGEDSALYRSDTPGQSQAVDFIGGAGGPNPQPGWIVDEPRYSESDWVDPFDHRIGESAPEPKPPYIPSYGELGDDGFFRAMIGVPLFADYRVAHENGHPDAKPNDGMSVWFSRTTYEILTDALKAGRMIDTAPIVRKYRNQWRAILGLPPV